MVLSSTGAPQFEKPFRIQLEKAPLVVKYGFPSVTMYDWDRDGVDDLIVGSMENFGQFRFYKNHGTKAQPLFKDDSTLLEAGGKPIKQLGCG